jgi:hypothetical protein
VLVIARQSQGNGRCQNGNVIFPFFHLNPMGVGEGKSLAGCPGDALAASPKRKLTAKNARACLESGLVERVYIVFATKETALEFRHSRHDYSAMGKRSWLRTWAVWCPESPFIRSLGKT